MKRKNPIRLGFSPVSRRIYAGRMGADGETMRDDCEDVTSDVLGNVIEYVGVGRSRRIVADGVPSYEISVRVLPPAPALTSSGEGPTHDTEHRDCLLCPHCGGHLADPDDLPASIDEGLIGCDHCGGSAHWKRAVTTTFTTTKR